MKVNGWDLYQHPLFKREYDALLTEAEHIKKKRPKDYQDHPKVKLLAKITELITKDIPAEPDHKRFALGNTLGKKYRHWKREKFGRYRLFFRYLKRKKKAGSEEKIIIYVWINDGDTLRKAGAKNDPYALFAKGLDRGEPPDSFEALFKDAELF